GANAGVALEVAVDVVLRFAALDAEIARQAPGAHAVHQAEVDGLGGPALFAIDLVGVQVEHLGGGGAVDVGAVGEGVQQLFVAGQMGHDPQFDLRVVGGQDAPALGRDEGFADAPTGLGAHRNVLQTGVGRGQPAGGGGGLVVAGVG